MIRTIPSLYGIIGSSLKESLSPVIFEFLYRKHDMNHKYIPVEFKENRLSETMRGLRSLGFKGINVTYPYKQAVIKYLDFLDEHSREIGAVNNVKVAKDRLEGYNTDHFGVIKTLEAKLRCDPGDKHICVIGAGGAARAFLYAVQKYEPTAITVVNRTKRRADELINEFQGGPNLIAIAGDDFENELLKYHNIKFDLVVNTSSADCSVTLDLLRKMNDLGVLKETSFFDMNYGVRGIQAGIPSGIVEHTDGLYMLSAQAAENFRIWYNQSTEIEEIEKHLRKEIQREIRC